MAQMFPHLAEFGLKHLQGADGGPTGEHLTGFRQTRRDLWECVIELGADAFEHLAGSLSREERIKLGAGGFRANLALPGAGLPGRSGKRRVPGSRIFLAKAPSDHRCPICCGLPLPIGGTR